MKLSLAILAAGAAIAGAWVPAGASNLAQCGVGSLCLLLYNQQLISRSEPALEIWSTLL